MYPMIKTLKNIKCGEAAVVVKLHGNGPLRRRILDLGLTKGAVVTVERCAPLGDPIKIRLRGYDLALRKAEADMVEVAAI